MAGGALFRFDDTAGGGQRLLLAGSWLVSTIGEVDQEFDDPRPLTEIDLSDVTEMDTIGAYLIRRISQDSQARLVGTDERQDRLFAAVADADSDADIRPYRPKLLKRVPQELYGKVQNAAMGLRDIIGFLGAMLAAAGMGLRDIRRFRLKALVRQMELVGVSALPIVGLMSFLIGIVVAQQGATQLRQFGAEIYTINLTGRLCLRELGVLMTAIMVAGRSGSAFAAQIGTMKLTEEVDAMRTIGISPMEALVLPRILAAVLMMPLLGFYASVMAIIGGAVIADLTLGIPFLTFLARIQEVVPTYDLWVGLIKAPLFGLIVALAGCYQGMQVEDNSEQVGIRTTTAVVQAIFAVIVLDAFFAIFFTNVGWG